VFVATEYALVTVGAVLTNEGWICVDTPPYPRDAQAWREGLRQISDEPVRYVVNTDCHRDRILGNAWFDAPVVAQEISAQQMLSLKPTFISQAAEELSTNDNELVAIASLRLVPPQISFADSLTVHCGEREIAILHKPGATFGAAWVMLAPEKVVWVGDTVCVGQHPLITEGNTKAWLNTLSDLRRDRFDGWTVVPGRGAPVDPSETETLSEYLRVARRRVAGLGRIGRPRSEVGALVSELLPFFPYEPRRRDEVQRRIKGGLEVIYDEMRSQQDGEDSAEQEQP
jgi:glyoxylase-like metal-dependent hydrolase (beta-lactamase superfamily II)